jgi:hypothetical protein
MVNVKFTNREGEKVSFNAVKKNPQEVKINFHFESEPSQIERLIDDTNKRKPEYNIPKEGRKAAIIEVNYERTDDVLIDSVHLAELLLNAIDQGGKNRTDSMIFKRELPFTYPESYGMIIMRLVKKNE